MSGELGPDIPAPDPVDAYELALREERDVEVAADRVDWPLKDEDMNRG